MTYNIIEEYIEFVKKSYLNLFKIIFKNRYHKEECLAFLNKYINVRYYNETNYPSKKDFVNRLNKELLDVLEKNATEENIDFLKNIVALFAYIIYLDDINYIVEDGELINSLVEDNIIKIDDKKLIKKELKEWYQSYKLKKEVFNNAISTNNFNLLEKRLYRKLFYVELEYNIKISNLYSEYAIDKAYNTGLINEDKAFVSFILVSSLVLNNAINLDFSKRYMVSIPSSIFTKEKKLSRLLNIFNNTLAKKFITIKVNYSDYMKNKEVINELINKGYFFSIELDSTYVGNITELFLFPYILVYNGSEEYEMLMRNKEQLKSKIIRL